MFGFLRQGEHSFGRTGCFAEGRTAAERLMTSLNLRTELSNFEHRTTQQPIIVDGKAVRIFACSSTREHSNERSRTKLKTESETGERR